MERQRLPALYEGERRRLNALAAADEPAGEYAHPVFGSGEAPARVLLIGEAPGAEETRLGMPFVGRAGKQLDALLEAASISRGALYITNVVKYRPVVRTGSRMRNRTPGRGEVAGALPLLLEELRHVDPEVVVTLGNTPLAAVLLLADMPQQTVGALHGRAHPLRISDRPMTLYPLYHPASGIYNRSLLPVMERDTAALGEYLANPK